jgi:hypothetical protein
LAIAAAQESDGEKALAETGRCYFMQQFTQSRSWLRGDPGMGMSYAGHLLLDGLDHIRMPVAYVHVDQLGRPIKILFTVRIPEVDPLSPGYGDRITGALGRPTGQGMGLIARYQLSMV